MDRFKAFAKIKIDNMSRFFSTDMMYVVKNGFWMNANFIFISFLGLISSIIFAHFVSKEVYGNYQYIIAIATIIAATVPNNMSSAVLRAVAQGYEGDLKIATRFQIRWGVIATVISSFISLWYAINSNFNLSIALIFIALLMPTTYALNTWSAYVQGKKDYKRFFFYNALSNIISYAGIIFIIFFKNDFIWIAFANLFFGLIANATIYFLTVKQMKPNDKVSQDTISYGAHLSVMGVPAGIVSQLDAPLIFHFIGAKELAIYSFATLLPEKLAGGLKFISSIIFPKFSEKSEVDVRGFFKKKIWWLFFFISVIAGAYAIISPYLFKWFFPTYLSSVAFTQVYSLSFFSIISGVVYTALLSQKKTRELYITNLTTPFVKAFLLVSLMFLYGVWGIIWAQIITIFFQIVFPIFLFNRKKSNKFDFATSK